MEPLLAGPTQLIITVGDGLHFTEVEIEVIVRAVPELSIFSVISVGHDLARNLEPGVLIDLAITIENRGRGPHSTLICHAVPMVCYMQPRRFLSFQLSHPLRHIAPFQRQSRRGFSP